MAWHSAQTQQFAVYVDGFDLIGIAEFEPPEFVQKTITLSALGDIEIPAPGLYEKLEAEIKFTSVSQPAFKLLDLNNKLLELKAVVNGIESTTHALESKGLYFAIRGHNKSFKIGTVKMGELIDTSFKLELTSIEGRLGGEKLFKVDKLNAIVEQLGVTAIKKLSEYVF